MARKTQRSKKKARKATLPILGAAGLSLAMVGESGAAAAPMMDGQPGYGAAGNPAVLLDEEELLDVTLGTFYVLDPEESDFAGNQLAQRGRGGGCRGCAAARCGGGRGCAVARCGGGRCAAVARCGGRCAVARCAVARCAVGRCRCAVGVRGCARCGCSCSGCVAPCWTWTGLGWVFVC